MKEITYRILGDFLMTSKLQADRIQRAENGSIELVILQPQDWETDPLLVKRLRDQVMQLQELLTDPQFRLQHRAPSAQIILETMIAPPPELRRWLVTEGIELRPVDPESEGPPVAIDRVHVSGSLAEIVLLQPLDWESDPLLVRNLRERVQEAIAYTTTSAFRKQYPKKQPSFVLEVMFSPPSDLREMLVDLGFTQIRPCEDSQTLALYANIRSTSPKAVPAPVSAPPKINSAPSTNPPPAAPSKAAKPAPAKPAPAKPAPAKNSTASQRSTPPAIPEPESWENDLDDVVEPLATGPNRGLQIVGGVLLLLGLLGLGYSLLGGEKAPDNRPQTIQASQVSNKTMTSLQIAQISVRPDRMTFVLIPVQDRKSHKVEYYTFFADRDNRQLLILAPVQDAQILKKFEEVVTNPDEPDRTTKRPIWQDDVQDPNKIPAARTYTGLLKSLRLRPSGPLELELPGENVNVNNIPALKKLGVTFPEHSMVLRVGETMPPPASNTLPLFLSLFLALIGGLVLFSAMRSGTPN